jgi:hypothetical protein
LVDPLVEGLTKLSKGITAVLEATDSWQEITNQITKFATWLAGPNDFAADPKWATFKDLLSEFLGLLGNIIGKMLEIDKTILGPGTNPGIMAFVQYALRRNRSSSNSSCKLLPLGCWVPPCCLSSPTWSEGG